LSLLGTFGDSEELRLLIQTQEIVLHVGQGLGLA
jgi:hypothetical protein